MIFYLLSIIFSLYSSITKREMSRKTLKKCKAHKKRTLKHRKIVQELKPITDEEMKTDYEKLKKISCKMQQKLGKRVRTGNKVVDAFTLEERLHAKGDQGISFFDFWMCKDFFAQKPYVKNMLEFYSARNTSELRKYRYIYNLYFSNIAIFSPLRAIEIYCKTNATRVLDFTMGWGGRLVGACANNLDAYYGIDINKHLKTPYSKMVSFLKSDKDITTDIKLLFEDALKTDYSKMDYDCVLTSPPYYDIEVYRGNKQKYKTNDEWNKKFYSPLFSKTFKHMKKGGYYCLNINEEIYENVCLPLFGKYTKRIEMQKEERKKGKSTYKEYVYCWKK